MKRILISMAILIAGVSSASADCPAGSEMGADLGIGLLQCIGGECYKYRGDVGSMIYDFSSEPVLRLVDPRPSGGALENGDVLVAVEGVPISSVSGGVLFGSLEAAHPVRLTIRRAQSENEVVITPIQRCHTTLLLVSTAREAEDGTWTRHLDVGRRRE